MGFTMLEQTQIHTAESLIPEPSPLEVDTATVKLNKCISLGSD